MMGGGRILPSRLFSQSAGSKPTVADEPAAFVETMTEAFILEISRKKSVKIYPNQ